MHLTVKLYAGLSRYLPAGSSENSTRIEIPEKTSVATVIDQLKVPAEQAHLVLVNGVYIEPEQRDNRQLREDDVLALWPPVAGG